MNSITDALNWRYAVKEFAPHETVPQNQVEIILESIRLTPTAFGLQHFKIALLSQSQIPQELEAACFHQKQIKSCSHLIILITRPPFSQTIIQEEVHDIAQDKNWSIERAHTFIQVIQKFLASKTPEQVLQWQINQTYLALGQLLTSCAIQKIDTCPMEGFIPNQINKILKLPAEYHTTLLCPIGYRQVQDPLQNLKSRRSIEQFIISPPL